MKIFRSYIELVEFMFLDEVYLDIIYLVRLDLLVLIIVNYICRDIYEVICLIVLVGVFYNKFLVKLVSGMNKLNGLIVIDYNNVYEILM